MVNSPPLRTAYFDIVWPDDSSLYDHTLGRVDGRTCTFQKGMQLGLRPEKLLPWQARELHEEHSKPTSSCFEELSLPKTLVKTLVATL